MTFLMMTISHIVEHKYTFMKNAVRGDWFLYHP